MLTYHTTDQADAILREGFRDGRGIGFVGLDVSGVFVSLTPSDSNVGAKGDHVLEVVFPDDFDLDAWAIEEEGLVVWEWCVPAALVNTHATARLLSDEEVMSL